MSIIDTFYYLFKSDTTQLKKGNEEAKKSSKDLSENLKETTQSVDKLGESFVNIAKSLTGAVAGFLSFKAVLDNLKDAYEYSLSLHEASEALNVNAEALDQWGRAVQKTGGTTERFQASLKGLAEHLNIRNQDALKLLPQLADLFHKVGNERSIRFGQKIGLDEPTILLLMKGRKELEAILARQKELGLVTKSDTEISKKFNDAWQNMSYAFRSVWINVGSTVLPILTKLVEGFTVMAIYFTEHSDLIVGSLLGIGAAAIIFAAPFVAANAAVIGLTLGIGYLIGAFAVAYDDFAAFEKGNNSIIGLLINKWPNATKLLKDSFDDFFQSLIPGLGILKEIVSLSKELKSIFASKNDLVLNAHKSIQFASSVPLNPQTSNSIFNNGLTSSKNVSLSTGNITINTQATDADEVSSSFVKGLQYHLRQATGTFDDGVVS